MPAPHEIPTHLQVEDTVAFGLTVRQLVVLSLGLGSSYLLWTHLTRLGIPGLVSWPVPFAVRLVLVILVGVLTLAITFVRLAGRALEVWVLVLLRALTAPRLAVWRPVPHEPFAPDGALPARVLEPEEALVDEG